MTERIDGEVLREPLLEEAGDRAGQAERDEVGGAGSGLGGGFEDGRQLVVGEARDHGGGEDGAGHSGGGQGGDGGQPVARMGGARLHHPGDLGVQGGDRDAGERRLVPAPSLVVPARTISVWGER